MNQPVNGTRMPTHEESVRAKQIRENPSPEQKEQLALIRANIKRSFINNMAPQILLQNLHNVHWQAMVNAHGADVHKVAAEECYSMAEAMYLEQEKRETRGDYAPKEIE